LKGGCVAPRCRGSVTVTVLGKDYCDVHNAARLDLAYAQRPQEGPAMRTLRLLDEEDVRTQRHARGDPASAQLGSVHETPSGPETEGVPPRKSGPGEASTPPAAPASGLSIEAPQQDGVPREGA